MKSARLLLSVLSLVLAFAWTPATIHAESYSGTLAAGTWAYFDVTLPEGHSGLRAHLAAGSANGARLYLRKGAQPTVSAYDQIAVQNGSKTLVVADGAANVGTWHVGVHWPQGMSGSFTYDLAIENGWARTLAWDAGISDAGSEVVGQPDLRGGWYYHTLVLGESSNGMWRVRLSVTSGEADIYMINGAAPFNPNAASYRSERIGADGFLLQGMNYPSVYTILVRANAGAEWQLFAGAAWAQPLPDLAAVNPAQVANDTSDSPRNSFVIPPEGQRLFRTVASSSTTVLGWRLWAYQHGESLNDWANPLAIRRAQGAMVDANRDWQQSGQMLVVPPYLGSGSDTYFLALRGEPGESGILDSRPQAVAEMAFSSHADGSNPAIEVNVPADTSGEGRFGYRTFRVQVPIQQLGWEINARTLDGSNPGIAVRKGDVPSEWFNDAMTEPALAGESSLTIAPPVLSDGTWYLTVFGQGPYRIELSSKAPQPLPVAVSTSNATTLSPQRAGWHYFVLSDIESQLGMLGWQIELANAAAGASIAIRRNALPIRPLSRSGWGLSITENAHYAAISNRGFLQQPNQDADVWYVGIYSATTDVGAFAMDTFPIQPASMADFNSANLTVSDQRPGEWRFFSTEIPATVNGQPVLGWEAKLTDVTGGYLEMTIRMDKLPPSLVFNEHAIYQQSVFASGRYVNSSVDLSGRHTSADGLRPWDGNHYTLLGSGRPLVTGTYYIGVYNAPSNQPTDYNLISRGVGSGMTLPVAPLNFVNGEVEVSNLQPRDVRIFAVEIPAGVQTWNITLENLVGESRLHLRRHVIPDNFGTTFLDPSAEYEFRSHASYRDGDETLVISASQGGELIAGTYYIAAVSEGSNPSSLNIGSGPASFRLRSNGEHPVIALGEVDTESPVERVDSYGAGKHNLYQFTLPAGLLALEVQLSNRVGNPVASMVAGIVAPTKAVNQPYNGPYGWFGGVSPDASGASVLSVSNPAPGTYTVLIGDGATHYTATSGTTRTAAGQYTLTIRALTESTLAFDGGVASVSNQAPSSWQYFEVEVPEGDPGLLGWKVRMLDADQPGLQMFISRDILPPLDSNQYLYSHASTWASGLGILTYNDPSGRQFDSLIQRSWDSSNYFLEAMGRPLAPGTYSIGILNTGSEPANYRIQSQAVGSGRSIEAPSIAFNGGQHSLSGLAPREVAFVTVDVPEGQKSWQIRAVAGGAGEARMYLRRGYIPSPRNFAFNANLYEENAFSSVVSHRNGNETLLLAPIAGESTIPAGRYYIMVVAEGRNPPQDYAIGEGAVDVSIFSDGELPIEQLGAIGPNANLSLPVEFPAGVYRAYQFSLAEGLPYLEISLEDRIGNPTLTLIQGDRLPTPVGLQSFSYSIYGFNGGHSTSTFGAPFVTLGSPSGGLYTLIVGDTGSHYIATSGTTRVADGSATLRLTSADPIPVAINGGQSLVLDHPAKAWRYFRVEVPESIGGNPVLGWELALLDKQSPNLQMTIRRGELPSSLLYFQQTFPADWPVGAGRTAQTDLTQRNTGADASLYFEGYNYMLEAMGRPLQPGTYYIGVRNDDTMPQSYRLRSRAVGEGMAIPVTLVAFAGGEANVADLSARDLRYFAVDVPEGANSWEFSATGLPGEVDMMVRRSYIPNDYNNNSSNLLSENFETLVVRRDGSETLVISSDQPEQPLFPGRYYVAVVSAGQEPQFSYSVGAVPVDIRFTSSGELPVQMLGELVANSPLQAVGEYPAGKHLAYQFEVPDGLLAFTVRIDDRVGNPVLAVRKGDQLPRLTTNQNYSGRYGQAGGVQDVDTRSNAITVNSPEAGIYTVLVGDGSSHYVPRTGTTRTSAGSFNLHVAALTVDPLNISQSQNTNGGTHTISETMASEQRRFLDVTVPQGLSLGNDAILGWVLRVRVDQGSLTVRVHHDPAEMDKGLTLTSGSHVIAAPYLRPGTWRVELQAGSAATSYVVENSIIQLQQAAWQMPAAGATATAPGLEPGYFGDSGVDSSGNALPDDQGHDIGDGDFHFYAVEVPNGNTGLLRTALIALNGNPDLYIRKDAPPSLSHNVTQQWWGAWAGEAVDHRLNGTGTEYGNWVPLNSTSDRELAAGTYYLAVRGNGSNVRYRLRLSTANLSTAPTPLAQRFAQAIPTDGTVLAGQTLASGDWRYYRFTVPQDPQTQLDLSYTLSSGNVTMYLRADVPPGDQQYRTQNDTLARHWGSDFANTTLNGTGTPFWPSPGSYTVACPPLRPGSTYWIGVRSKADSVFSISARFHGPLLSESYPPLTALDFRNGQITTDIAPGQSLFYRVDAPDAVEILRLIWNRPTNVSLSIENGTLPLAGLLHHHSMSSDTYTRELTGYPWLAGDRYFLRLTNSGSETRSVSIQMNGMDSFEEPQWSATTALSTSGFTVNWQPLPVVDFYYLQVSTNPEFSSSYLFTTVDTSATYTLSGLLPESTFYLRVYAYLDGVNSAYSEVLTVTTLTPPPLIAVWAAQFGLIDSDPLTILPASGKSLLEAYALGADPLADFDGTPLLHIVAVGDEYFAELEFNQRTDDPKLRYQVRTGTSPGAGNARAISTLSRINQTPVSAGIERLRIRLPEPVRFRQSVFHQIEYSLLP